MSKANPSLLELLNAGAKVQFNNETWLHGDPKDRYIRVGYMGLEHGVWSLDKDGLAQALEDVEKIYAEQCGDDFTDLTGSDGYIGGIGIMTGSECQDDRVSFAKGEKPMAYNIVNENHEWLDGAATRVDIRRKFVKRLAKV